MNKCRNKEKEEEKGRGTLRIINNTDKLRGASTWRRDGLRGEPRTQKNRKNIDIDTAEHGGE